MPISRAAIVLIMLCNTAEAISEVAGNAKFDVDYATKKLDEDVKACRPIDVTYYSEIQKHALKRWGLQGLQNQGRTTVADQGKISEDVNRAHRLLNRAKEAAARQKTCQPHGSETTEKQPDVQTRPPSAQPPTPQGHRT